MTEQEAIEIVRDEVQRGGDTVPDDGITEHVAQTWYAPDDIRADMVESGDDPAYIDRFVTAVTVLKTTYFGRVL